MSEPEAIQPTTSTNDPDVTLDDAENEEKVSLHRYNAFQPNQCLA